MTILQGLVTAFSMYSKIPMPQVEWSEKSMRYTLCFFPLVGVVLGVIIMAASRILSQAGFATGFQAALLTAIPLLITGGIHMDGFLDTIDAKSSGQSREKKLEILKDSRSGAFAVMWGGLYLLLQFGVWTEASGTAPMVIATGYVLSRSLSGLSVATFPMAKNSGLVAMFHDAAVKRAVIGTMAAGIILSVVLMGAAGGLPGLLAAVMAVLCFLYYRYMAVKEFGGTTGDLAGYFLQICELLVGIAVVLAGK